MPVRLTEEALSNGDEASALRREALRIHDLLGVTFEFDADAPLPSKLLGAARLHAMSESELWLYEPTAWQHSSSEHGPPPVAPLASAASEWRALVKLRDAIARSAPAADGCCKAGEEVAALIGGLCDVVPEPVPLHRHASDSQARELLAALGGRGAVCVGECAVGGRGLVAERPLLGGEIALALPASALITAATARRELPAAVLTHLEREGPWAEHLLVMVPPAAAHQPPPRRPPSPQGMPITSPHHNRPPPHFVVGRSC